MQKQIEISTIYFFKEVLGQNVEISKKSPFNNVLYARISIFEDGIENIFYFFIKKQILMNIGKIWLGEENLNIGELKDILNEITNQIVGNAKMRLEEIFKDKDYKLSTPIFVENIEQKLKVLARFKIDGQSIAIKKVK